MIETMIRAAELAEGMRLSRDLCSRYTNIVLLPVDTVITSTMIRIIGKLDIEYAYVYETAQNISASPDGGNRAFPAPDNEEKATVLVVDDEQEICDYMKMVIEERDMNAITAASASEAWDHIKNSPEISTVFLDIKMPETNGFELLRKIREELARELDVVMVTCSRSVNDVMLARQLGAIDYVTKPFDPERLFKNVRVAERPSSGN